MSKVNQFSLFRMSRFAPFFGAQVCGAFNDNLFKNALLMLIAFKGIRLSFLSNNMLVNLCAGLFILPLLLFSTTAGQMADKYDKARYIQNIKLLEVIIMVLATVAFYINSIILLMLLLFVLGILSTFFSPVKYSILPQTLTLAELTGANGLIEMSTYIAILLGVIGGSYLVGLPYDTTIISLLIVSVAVIGWLCSRYIPHTIAAAPNLIINWNIVTETFAHLKYVTHHRTILLSVLGISWFWFFGTFMLTQVPNYTATALHANEDVAIIIFACFAIGVGTGSLLSEKLSSGIIEVGLVPLGAIGLSLFSFNLWRITPIATNTPVHHFLSFVLVEHHWRIMFNIFLLGFFAGIYSIPLFALVQARTPKEYCARVFAANNILNALFMLLAALLGVTLSALHLTMPQFFLVLSLLNIMVTIYIFTLVPEFVMRLIVWLLLRIFYRIEVTNLDRIPDHGAAVIVSNHVSWIDSLVIGGCCRRPVRFVMDYAIYNKPFLNFIFRAAHTIPIASAKINAALKEEAFQNIATTLQAGNIVCIFPEGAITRNGEIQEFKSGIERIIKETPVPVIPIALRGLWASFFSRRTGKKLYRLPRRLRARIGLAVGEPVQPAVANRHYLQDCVQALRGNEK